MSASTLRFLHSVKPPGKDFVPFHRLPLPFSLPRGFASLIPINPRPYNVTHHRSQTESLVPRGTKWTVEPQNPNSCPQHFRRTSEEREKEARKRRRSRSRSHSPPHQRTPPRRPLHGLCKHAVPTFSILYGQYFKLQPLKSDDVKNENENF